MKTDPEAVSGLLLRCQPAKAGNAFVFTYTIENLGVQDAYVMDAMPGVDAATGKPLANDQGAVVQMGPGSDATLGKFIPPMPTDRRMACPVVPLARRLGAGQMMESRLTLPIPLAESSPYFADLPLRQYEAVEVEGVLFTVGFWLAATEGLAALPVIWAPDLLTVVGRDTAGCARRMSQHFPTKKLQLFKRTDAFPRDVGAH